MKSLKSRMLMFVAMSCAVATGVGADSITIDGTAHTDVVIRQSEAMYYVQVPESGRVLAAFKSEVDPETVKIGSDPAHRAGLLRQWRAKQANGSQEPSGTVRSASVSRVTAAVKEPARTETRQIQPLKLGPNRPFSGAGPANPSVRAVAGPAPGSVGAALKAQLRPMGLDYRVRPGGVLFVSTPERLRLEAMEPLETRIYTLQNLGAEVLPKVIVRNEGGRMGGLGNASGRGGTGGRTENIADIISRGPSAGEAPVTAN